MDLPLMSNFLSRISTTSPARPIRRWMSPCLGPRELVHDNVPSVGSKRAASYEYMITRKKGRLHGHDPEDILYA